METKLCLKCREIKPITEFYVKYINEKKGEIHYYSHCKICHCNRSKKWRNSPSTNNPLNNAERTNVRKRKDNKVQRLMFLAMYGNRCECCGETTQEFLTIEHKNGQKGIKHSKKDTGHSAYRKAVKEFRPDLYTILCWNCNCSKGRYGYCPHQK